MSTFISVAYFEFQSIVISWKLANCCSDLTIK